MSVVYLISILCIFSLFQDRVHSSVIPVKQVFSKESETAHQKLNNDTTREHLQSSVENNAGCLCTNGECMKKDGKEVCECPPEFGYLTRSYCKACKCGKGANCTIEAGWTTKITCICPKGYHAVKERCIGPCEPNPCKNKGTCEDVDNGFECVCPSTHTGKTCETKDPCTDQPCLNGGICKLYKDSFKCYCTEHFFGTKCEIVDPCATLPCQNGGVCLVNGDSFKCMCKTPYTGEKCEKVYCDASLCKHGKCQVIGEVHSCLCYQGYIGPKCDQEEIKIEGCGSKCVALIVISALLGLSVLLNIFILCKYRLQ
ncbi:fibropellin-1 [Trichonephila inaurata madagascariensis]|uniref:Fibropellin-1 n=1 Tax=Trichonephila inaurata madagascariensis TaxID=2747483 RepID=A0A8X6YN55_9ARAC|nr:fibropellin-1 [Trichonephila inaurata madagascariensis]